MMEYITQVFMAASMVAGLTMLAFTVGFAEKFKRLEVCGRIIFFCLLLYSVLMRFYFSLPGPPDFSAGYFSLIFDVFYISICAVFVANIFIRITYGR